MSPGVVLEGVDERAAHACRPRTDDVGREHVAEMEGARGGNGEVLEGDLEDAWVGLLDADPSAVDDHVEMAEHPEVGEERSSIPSEFEMMATFTPRARMASSAGPSPSGTLHQRLVFSWIGHAVSSSSGTFEASRPARSAMVPTILPQPTAPGFSRYFQGTSRSSPVSASAFASPSLRTSSSASTP